MSQEPFAYQSSTIFDKKVTLCRLLFVFVLHFGSVWRCCWMELAETENALNRSSLITLPPLLQN